jgi:hypothetical protein
VVVKQGDAGWGIMLPRNFGNSRGP